MDFRDKMTPEEKEEYKKKKKEENIKKAQVAAHKKWKESNMVSSDYISMEHLVC